MRIVGFAFAVLLLAVFGAEAQNRGRAEAELGDGKSVVIDYGRPLLRGRDVEAALPPGMLWRMGMNQVTTLEADTALDFGELEIPSGTHSLYLRRIDASRWALVVNRQTGQWGTQYDPEQDLGRVPLVPRELPENVERFTISLEAKDGEGRLELAWGKLALTTTFLID